MVLEVDPACITVIEPAALVLAPQWCRGAVAVDALLAV